MKYLITFTSFFILFFSISIAQSFDAPFSNKKMLKDLQLFKDIRFKTNSGLNKYRTKKEIDSIYNWAFKAINKLKTYGDFYNLLCELTDFEGSTHNYTGISNKVYKSIKNEEWGYFPFPIKLIGDKVLLNIYNEKIPLGAELISINEIKMHDILPNLYKYYTTDGINITGKSIGINRHFSKFYRLHYGKQKSFSIKIRIHGSSVIEQIEIESGSYSYYYKNVENRFSKPFDEVNYKDWKESEIYNYKLIDMHTAILTINSFSMGNEETPMHLRYLNFLDNTFSSIKKNKIKNLIVDIRYNGGGSDPNDLVTYSYLTNRLFSENKQAWITFNKIPYLKYNSNSSYPYFMKLIGVRKYNKEFKKEFPEYIKGRFYQNSKSNDHRLWKPNKNAFHGNIYLLISPRVASAGSLFGAMLAGNKNAIVIGEETMGGYYGHNGHVPLNYRLPKSKIDINFFIVNLEQDVVKKENQAYNRGIIPDYNISQSFDDYLNHTDVQLDFTLKLIEKNSK